MHLVYSNSGLSSKFVNVSSLPNDKQAEGLDPTVFHAVSQGSRSGQPNPSISTYFTSKIKALGSEFA